jgi:general stress protein 26
LTAAHHVREEFTMPVLAPDVRRALDGASIAHLASVLPDGAPHAVPVVVDTHGDRIAILTGPNSRKARNLRRGPRVAVARRRRQPFQPIVFRGRVIAWIDGDPPGRSSIASP